jgi:hypothetical protein
MDELLVVKPEQNEEVEYEEKQTGFANNRLSEPTSRIDWFADELQVNLFPAHPRLNNAVDCCL